MANVRSFLFPQHDDLLTPIFVAGSGKSVLWFVVSCYCLPASTHNLPSSGIIEDTMAECESRSAIVAYFYCDFNDESKQNCHNFVRSIISQLCDQSNICYQTLSRIFSEHSKVARKPSDETLDETLTKFLMTMVSHPSLVQAPIYLIVDALDECPNDSGFPTSRKEVLNLIENLVLLRLPNLHTCVTSRLEFDIQTTLEPLASRRVTLHAQSGQKKDLMNYVHSIVYSDDEMKRWGDEDKEFVVDTLSKRAEGM
jgi:hypothetical protein